MPPRLSSTLRDSRRSRRGWAFVVTASLLLLLSPLFQTRQTFSLLERMILTPLFFSQEVLTTSHEAVRGFWNTLTDLWKVHQQNQALEEEVRRLRESLVQLQEIQVTVDRLEALLDLKRRLPFATRPARVIGRDPTSWFQRVVINRGSQDGVVPAQGVLGPEGVVGKVLRVGPSYAQVQLLLDRGHALAGRIQRTRVACLVEGAGDHLMLRYVPRDGDVAPGDLVVTSGLDGIFPPGLPVARVTRVEPDPSPLFLHVEAKPLANLSRLETVLILRIPGKESP